MSRFEGKVVIVTGSTSGIGAATAILFAKEGAKITITGRNEKRAKEIANTITEGGVPKANVQCVIADVTIAMDRQRIVEKTVAKWGHLDILVNNAGASITHGRTGFMDNESAYRDTMDLNLSSVLQLINLARPHLIKNKGEIVNVSSIMGLGFANPDTPYYSIAKAALDQMTRSLSIDLIRHGVRVNGVSPGLVETSFLENMGLSKEQSKKAYKFYGAERNCIPRGKIGEPVEIANVIAFLADRHQSSYIIGQTIVVDGGTSLILGASAYDMVKVLTS